MVDSCGAGGRHGRGDRGADCWRCRRQCAAKPDIVEYTDDFTRSCTFLDPFTASAADCDPVAILADAGFIDATVGVDETVALTEYACAAETDCRAMETDGSSERDRRLGEDAVGS